MTRRTAPARTLLLAAAAGLTAAAAVVGAPAAAADTAPPAPRSVMAATAGLTPRAARRSPTLVRVWPAGMGMMPRRTLDPLSVAPCNHRVDLWIADDLRTVADFGGGPRLTGVESVRALRAGGFTWAEMTTGLAVMAAESDRCPAAVHHNIDPVTGVRRSTDTGLWQINDHYHPQYATWDLTDPAVASRAAKQIKDRAGSWAPWHGYENRDLFMGWAEHAVAEARAAGVR